MASPSHFLQASFVRLTFSLNIRCTRVGIRMWVLRTRDLLLRLQTPPHHQSQPDSQMPIPKQS